MIRFSGIVPLSIQADIMRRRNKSIHGVMFFTCLGLLCLTAIGAIVISQLNDSSESWWGLLVFASITTAVFGLVYMIPNNGKKDCRVQWKHTVEIENGIVTDYNENEVVKQNPSFYQQMKQKPINKIKKVIDFGDYYLLYCGGAWGEIICVKELLTDGSIAEFESMFSLKLKRKKK